MIIRKLVYFIFLCFLVLFIFCRKESDESLDTVVNTIASNDTIKNTNDDTLHTNPYALPWNTQNIRYENTVRCRSSHSSGYRLYYIDSLLEEDCIDFGGIGIRDSMLVNDSILHLFFSGSNGSHVLTTRSGGINWQKYHTGPPFLAKFHKVNENLSYCVSRNQNDLYFTGIGQSDLSILKDTLRPGKHLITDLGTVIRSIDSTLIKINDSVAFVIRFKD